MFSRQKQSTHNIEWIISFMYLCLLTNKTQQYLFLFSNVP